MQIVLSPFPSPFPFFFAESYEFFLPFYMEKLEPHVEEDLLELMVNMFLFSSIFMTLLIGQLRDVSIEPQIGLKSHICRSEASAHGRPSLPTELMGAPHIFSLGFYVRLFTPSSIFEAK